jgi:hypothetical protein
MPYRVVLSPTGAQQHEGNFGVHHFSEYPRTNNLTVAVSGCGSHSPGFARIRACKLRGAWFNCSLSRSGFPRGRGRQGSRRVFAECHEATGVHRPRIPIERQKLAFAE